MLTYLLPIFSAILCSVIEYYRIQSIKNNADNVNKFWTVTIMMVLFGVCLALSVNYYDDIMPDDVIAYFLYYIGCRGVIYDSIVSVLRGLRFDYVSSTTNSRIDAIFRKYGGFWGLKAFSFVTAIIGAILWHLRY